MILSPDSVALSGYRLVIDSMAARLLPAGLQDEKQIQVSAERGLLVAVLGRRDHVVTRDFNILGGVTLAASGQTPWWRLDGPVPDGSFAMFRSQDLAAEAVTDYVGSKTIWHVRLACGGVVVSTCVELIVALLGEFCVDDRALGWFLSAGTCGPGRSWDKRIKPVAPNSRLRVQKEGAAITLREMPLERPPQRHDHVDAACLETELRQTMSSTGFGDKPWVLALSGGYDSRAILYGTRHLEELTCVTWVDEFLVDQPDSDLAIARRLAASTGRKHVVKVIKRPADATLLDQALRRFMRYCDGRVDNYLAYVDGMQIWDELSTSDAGGLLRGDELFGSTFAARTPQILQNMRLISFSEYARGNEQRELAFHHDHSTPEDLSQRPGESAARWRWRLRADYEIPTVYAALNSIRARFTEVSCPLLTGRLVRLAASMSRKSLDDKALFNQVVRGMFPQIPFATRTSILRRSDVLAIPQTTELVLDHLGSAVAREVLGARSVERVRNELAKLADRESMTSNAHGIATTRKSVAPNWLKKTKRCFAAPPEIHWPTLGMRSYLANVIQEEMTDIANLGVRAGKRTRHVSP